MWRIPTQATKQYKLKWKIRCLKNHRIHPIQLCCVENKETLAPQAHSRNRCRVCPHDGQRRFSDGISLAAQLRDV